MNLSARTTLSTAIVGALTESTLEANKNTPNLVGQCFLSLVPSNKFSLTSCMGIFKASGKEIAKDIYIYFYVKSNHYMVSTCLTFSP
jgi:hypothetical protein